MSHEQERRDRLIEVLERMASGEHDLRIPLSPEHDHLDAIAHGINVLVGELQYATNRQKRAAEIADAANRAKTQFLRNVSHEIRTPLSAMLGIARLLQQPDLEGLGRQELIARLFSNGDALLAIIDELLDISRLEVDGLQLDLEPFEANAFVDSVVRDLEPTARARGLRLSITREVTRDTVLADPRRVRQILTNLIGNAIKFTEHGGVEVRILLARETGRVAIEVSDTGIGLTHEQARRLFEPFQQADASIADRFGGSGLGLALSQRMARAMGGGLSITRSRPGEGTTFRLLLPPAPAPSEPAAAAAAPSAPPPSRLDGLRILLAEDHADIRIAMAELLGLHGAEVTEAGDGLAALERASHESFDVLLVDVRMPRMDGLEATRLLRTRGVQTPIIALTADAVNEHREECLAAGCNAYLAKPVVIGQLFDTIHRLARGPHGNQSFGFQHAFVFPVESRHSL